MKYLKGGSFADCSRYCRSASVICDREHKFFKTTGFRIACSQTNLESLPSRYGNYLRDNMVSIPMEKPFLLMRIPVTGGFYKSVSWGFKYHGDYPQVGLTWCQAVEFCSRLSEMTDHEFTLPTSAQWEHACRAGTTTAYYFGDDPGDLGEYGWYNWNCDRLQPVGKKKPNPWGLYDMHGLVWEWCLDGPKS